jgi:hypothetical protein
MARLLRSLEAIGLVLWIFGLGAGAVTAARACAHRVPSTPYLPWSGPAPLRFEAARPISRPAWPPLLPPNRSGGGKDGPATDSAPLAMAPLPLTNPPISAVRVMSPAPLPVAAPRLDVLPSSPVPEDQNSAPFLGIDQRLLIEFLGTLPTNGPARNRLSSPVFIPPLAPPPPRPSQATYESR